MIYQWIVIGAGPAGIIAVGKLLDHGVKAQEIAWIDPAFKVGDFGTLWRDIKSNTHAGLFLQALHTVESFAYKDCANDFALNHIDKNMTCYLRLVAEPLQWITDCFKEKVFTIQDYVEKLTLSNRLWNLQLKNSAIKVKAKNVILAPGVEPKKLTYVSSRSQVIPLEDAIVKTRLKKHVSPLDTVAVFGSSHSAVLILKNLVESNVKRIINFYRSPFFYAVYQGDVPLFGNAGLLGEAAQWARDNIDGVLPNNLTRVLSNDENIKNFLPECNKIIYAVGFQRRQRPIIEGVEQMKYVDYCGIIAPGLFGFGIAYPQTIYNSFGIKDRRIGIWKFMDYLQRVIPIWLNYPA